GTIRYHCRRARDGAADGRQKPFQVEQHGLAEVVEQWWHAQAEALGDDRLWNALSELGVQGIHNGPMKRSGGLRGREFTPTIDGNFDRISFEIDPSLGTEEQMLQLSRVAA
ncbi:hypothetical protein, partial [Klebsiella pneumoniae]|uniref:hypothetical protein n=1 Tax=Klebsiella pneumoniae TaxID=573 RepID=UPI003A7F86F1